MRIVLGLTPEHQFGRSLGPRGFADVNKIKELRHPTTEARPASEFGGIACGACCAGESLHYAGLTIRRDLADWLTLIWMHHDI